MSTQDKTPQDEKAVADALDGAGQQIMVLFRKNAQDLREVVDSYNELVRTSAANESANTALLTKLRGEIDEALAAHTPIATALNNGEQVSPAEVEEALAATEAARQSELEWKAMVERTLADYGQRITNLEENKVIPIPAPASVPTPEPKSEPQPEEKRSEEKATAVAVVEQKLDEPKSTVIPRYVNPKVWGGLAWTLAAIGFIVGGLIALSIQGSFFPGVPDPMQWVRWLTLMMFPVFGLFVGGTIGSFIESRQADNEVATTRV